MTGSLVRLANTIWTGVVTLVARIVRPFGVTIGRPSYVPTACGPTDPTPGCNPNPWACGADIEVFVRDATGALATYSECGEGPHTVVRETNGVLGVDVAARASPLPSGSGCDRFGLSTSRARAGSRPWSRMAQLRTRG